MRNVLLALLVAALSATPILSQETNVTFKRSEHVTAAEINSEAGFKFEVKGIGTVWLRSVKNNSKKKGTCFVHMPSIVSELKKKGKPKPEPQEVSLKFRNYGGDDFGCRGGGNDCVVVIELPDVK